MKTFWSYRLHKLGTQKVLRTDGPSGPTTIPAFHQGDAGKKFQEYHHSVKKF